uniref:HORMA domain containing 1 n=1 Tax=Tetraodon nigroviridis TaxID=99883 RepID=H3CKZ2_TETNG
MACVQQLRTTQESQLLPQQVLSEQQSSVVIRKLLAIAVSGITYLRGLFPEKAYGKKYVEDQKVMILREEGSCPGTSQIVQWLQGCFEAIQLKYLKTVVMSIYTDPDIPQTVTEFYQFNIQYTPQGAHLDFESNKMSMSCGNTRKASILLVRKLYTLMQNLGPLPDSVSLNMKLAYYQEVTPQDYQPPGFKEAESDTFVFEKEPVKLTMGEVVTPYHSLKLGMATERHRLEQVEESVNVTEKWVLSVTAEELLSQSEEVEKSEMENTPAEAGERQLICHEKLTSCEESTQVFVSFSSAWKDKVDTVCVKTSSVEVGQRRTRSGRIISSTTISQYQMPDSQEAPSASAPQKKRKFSEPKEPF